ncbi:hypothetical protein F4806DRAFT_481128 [Annulohypoxylon nitens]|nr:hypothetical protein F4806DRAFT_481128 [Annulohypoxylon nitens]
MALSVEAIIAIVSLFIATPPTILMLASYIRHRRYLRARQRASVDQLRTLQRIEQLRTLRSLSIELGRLFEDEVRNHEEV